MIKIEKVNKYFNRHKKNEIHVINNTSLEFKNTGLVALLGPSGCGKTTLLNTIGGLDRINKGKIFVDGQKITGRTVNKIDKIRNLNIGYIFQDYNLIDSMTVYDNITLVLKMIGVKDKNEVKARTDYILEKVGMYRYRNRLAGMLSGGERQRVGIARAIVKNPAIIIADEPTGNLDSRNTIEIMNIIKAISREKLVILVTHEKELAYFYSSRIIELKDGCVVSDKDNKHNNELDYQMDNKIYLKDFEVAKNIKNDNCKINYFSDKKDNIDIEIVVKNGNIYVKNNAQGKVEVIDNSSSIELVDDHYKKITKDDYEKYQFHLDKLVNKKNKYHYTSILNPITTVTNGFKKVFDYPFIKKLLLLGFFLSAMFILYSISNIYGILDVKDEKFVMQNKNYLTIISNKVKVEDYLNYEKENSVNYILPGDSQIFFSVKYNDFYQTSKNADNLIGSLSSLKMINSKDLVYGVMPTSSYEIVVDKLTITKMYDNKIAQQAGYVNVWDMLGKIISTNNMPEFKVVGIVDLESPSIYTSEDVFMNIIANSGESFNMNIEAKEINDGMQETTNFVDYTLKQGELTLKKGKWPKNNYEVVVNINNKDNMPLNKKISTKINNTKLKVVGYYSDKYESDYMLVNSNSIKYNLISTKSNIIVYPKDKDDAINIFQGKKLNIEDTYTKSRNDYLKELKSSMTISLVIAGIILVISFVEIYLIIRSSFLSRIKEVGIYRAIGVKKSDIYKMFLGEIIAITTMASVTGYLFMVYILKKIMVIKYLGEYYQLDAKVLILSIVIIYIFNIVVGLLPVMGTIKKTPAQILSRNDVD